MNVEAMAEDQGFARLQVRSDVALVNTGLMLIGDQDMDDVSFLGQFGGRNRFEAVLDGQRVVGGSFELGNDDVDAALAQVLGLGVALAAIADDADGLPGQEAQIGVVVVV
jgi:hypothetical protein